MKKFRFHLLGLAHLPAHEKYSSCAFTQKNRKLAKMLTSLGHTVFYYGSDGSDIADYCGNTKLLKHIVTHRVSDIAKDYGDGDNRYSIGYNWHNGEFRHDFNDAEKKPSTKMLYDVASEYINKIKKPDDFLLRTMGRYHDEVANRTGLVLDCESGIGYTGSEPSSENHLRFRCYESSSMMHYSLGAEYGKNTALGINYDVVIPNYFERDAFRAETEKGDYLLFVGRMIKTKGILTAVMTARALGKKLIIAGQGGRIDERGHLIGVYNDFDIEPGGWEYVGVVSGNTRKELYAKALITLVPTEYIEPFGGVNVESRLSGTPVLCTNFGAFPEQIKNGVDGYCCNTLDDFVYRGKQLLSWSDKQYSVVAKRAERYLMDNVKWEYQKWFEDLHMLVDGGKGWPEIRKRKPEFRSVVG